MSDLAEQVNLLTKSLQDAYKSGYEAGKKVGYFEGFNDAIDKAKEIMMRPLVNRT